ncbi:hypothetical protein Glove_346g4 [Diversispora epigaea]|uniref:Uncharacterized protein n=1 Tax=Diversispora epigaea TaxID=1348612 RepID=A0A397HF47_9GLOM|nr:hypothetical protein Glove_346g4 [Diversispora epigaea]
MEESSDKENKLLQHLLDAYDAYLEKYERDDSSDENEIKLADQEYSLKITALKCNVAVGAYTISIIVNSGTTISIIIRDVMEQLDYEIEKTFKINTSYNWSEQELTLRWREKTLTIPANCLKEIKEKFSKLIENTDEKNINESDTETKNDEEIIFKNIVIKDDNNENNENTIPFDKLMKQNKDLFVNNISLLEQTNIIKHQIDVGEVKLIKQRFYRTHPDEELIYQRGT